MGFWGDLGRSVNYVVTLGGSSRLKDAQEEYAGVLEEHADAVAELRRFETRINQDLTRVGERLDVSRKHLRLAGKLLRVDYSSKALPTVSLKASATRANQLDTRFSSTLAAGVGGAAGGAIALGSWALVTTFGTASTGAAIGGLTGVALTNATFAWFGGGALAAGGAGMAGGMAVLGGIVAVPMVAFAAYSTHSKANEIEEASVKLRKHTVDVRKSTAELVPISKAVSDWRQRAEETISIFNRDVTKMYAIIRPWGVLSYLKQKILVLFRQEPLSVEQRRALTELSDAVDKFGLNFPRSELTAPNVNLSIEAKPVQPKKRIGNSKE